MSKVRLYGDTSGYVDLKAPDVANDVTITLPNTTGPFATETYVDAEVLAGRGLVAVKSALFTGTQTNSTASGANFAVTDLSITHEVADVSNVLLFFVSVGQIGISEDYWNAGCALAVDGTLVNIGDAASSRTPTTSSSRFRALTTGIVENAGPVSFATAYTPGAGSKVYTVRAINPIGTTETIYINRDPTDGNASVHTRSSSSFVMMEVSV